MPFVLMSLLLLLLVGPSAGAQTEDESPSFLSDAVTLVPAVEEPVILQGGSSVETLDLRAVGVPGVRVEPSRVTLAAHGVVEVSVRLDGAVTPRAAFLIATREGMVRARVPISLASGATNPVPERLVLQDVQFFPGSKPAPRQSSTLGPLFAGLAGDIGLLSADTGDLAVVSLEHARLVVRGLERGSYGGSVAIPGVPHAVAVELDVRHHWLLAVAVVALLAYLHAATNRFRETDQPFGYRLDAVGLAEVRMREEREKLARELTDKLGESVPMPRVDGPDAALQNESQRLVDEYVTTPPGERAAYVADPQLLANTRGIEASYTILLAEIRSVLSEIDESDAGTTCRLALVELLGERALPGKAAVDELAGDVGGLLPRTREAILNIISHGPRGEVPSGGRAQAAEVHQAYLVLIGGTLVVLLGTGVLVTQGVSLPVIGAVLAVVAGVVVLAFREVLGRYVSLVRHDRHLRRARPKPSDWTRGLRRRERFYGLATAIVVVSTGLVALYWTQPDFGGWEDYVAMGGWTAFGGEGANYLKRFLLR